MACLEPQLIEFLQSARLSHSRFLSTSAQPLYRGARPPAVRQAARRAGAAKWGACRRPSWLRCARHSLSRCALLPVTY